MAGFQGHITASTALGIGLGFVGHWSGQFSDTTCFIGGCLCSFAGMLPDLDSVNSRQHREIIGFLGAVVAAFTIQRLTTNHVSMDIATVCACLIYLGIRFGLSWLIRTNTYHRGMFHSIPAAILAGEMTFLLLANTSSNGSVLFKSLGVVLGYLSHLILDELCSVASNGRIQVKKSLGTAFKIFGKSPTVNLVMLALVLLLAEPIAATLNQSELQIASSTTPNPTDSATPTSESTSENTTKIQNFFASIFGSPNRSGTGASSTTLVPSPQTPTHTITTPLDQYRAWAAQLANRDNPFAANTSANTTQTANGSTTEASRFLSQVLTSQWIAGENSASHSDNSPSSLTAVSPTPLAPVSAGTTWQAGETQNVTNTTSTNPTLGATSGLVISTIQSFLNRTSPNTVSYTEALTETSPNTESRAPVKAPSVKQTTTWW